MRRQIVQIVPPESGGVRDFAQCLQARWAGAGQPSQLHAFDPLAIATGPQSAQTLSLSATCVTSAAPLSVLLHFSGYGYHPRSLCYGLLRAVESLRADAGPGLRLVTYFHELFASGPPWRSAFWLGGLQAGLARRLAALSDVVLTNSTHHAQWLGAQARTPQPVLARPVFANIEPAAPPLPMDRREPRVVLFGSATTRARALRALQGRTDWLRQLGAEGITEIGPPGPTETAANDHPWSHRCLGPLPPQQVSEALARHRFALIDYPDIHLGKSSVFAAYAAHGCVAVNTARCAQAADGLVDGREYRSMAGLQANGLRAGDLQAMADAARRWYAGHDGAHQARDCLSLLHPPVQDSTEPALPH